MCILAISLGVNILFAVALVGGLGEIYYTIPVVISGITILSAGILSISNKIRKVTFYLLCVSFIAYMPIIIQQFTANNDIDWLSIFFNVSLLLLIGLLVIYYKPNKSFNSQPPAAGAPQSGAN